MQEILFILLDVLHYKYCQLLVAPFTSLESQRATSGIYIHFRRPSALMPCSQRHQRVTGSGDTRFFPSTIRIAQPNIPCATNCKYTEERERKTDYMNFLDTCSHCILSQLITYVSNRNKILFLNYLYMSKISMIQSVK